MSHVFVRLLGRAQPVVQGSDHAIGEDHALEHKLAAPTRDPGSDLVQLNTAPFFHRIAAAVFVRAHAWRSADRRVRLRHHERVKVRIVAYLIECVCVRIHV